MKFDMNWLLIIIMMMMTARKKQAPVCDHLAHKTGKGNGRKPLALVFFWRHNQGVSKQRRGHRSDFTLQVGSLRPCRPNKTCVFTATDGNTLTAWD